MSETPRRRAAQALMRHAARIMPRGDWGKAMQNELQAIDDDHVALRWAFGCVIAGYGERMNVMLQTWYARSALACLIVLLALREFFAPLLIFAYRTQHLGLRTLPDPGRTQQDQPEGFCLRCGRHHTMLRAASKP